MNLTTSFYLMYSKGDKLGFDWSPTSLPYWHHSNFLKINPVKHLFAACFNMFLQVSDKTWQTMCNKHTCGLPRSAGQPSAEQVAQSASYSKIVYPSDWSLWSLSLLKMIIVEFCWWVWVHPNWWLTLSDPFSVGPLSHHRTRPLLWANFFLLFGHVPVRDHDDKHRCWTVKVHCWNQQWDGNIDKCHWNCELHNQQPWCKYERVIINIHKHTKTRDWAPFTFDETCMCMPAHIHIHKNVPIHGYRQWPNILTPTSWLPGFK